MLSSKNTPTGSAPTPPVTYKNPRRTSPENSITLRHHRLAQEAARRFTPPGVPNAHSSLRHSRRMSSGESNETGLSDPKNWFESANGNTNGTYDTSQMDVDPPFFQKETDSSNEDIKYGMPSQTPAYNFVQNRVPALRPGATQSSSAGDYRSVIDDLTVENKRLKDELKKYRQKGPDSLRRDKLFELKVHGLPRNKRRELEAALRDFTTSLPAESSAGASPSGKKGSGKLQNRSASKHASSSSGSNSRPVDSAYASMSNDQGSSSAQLPHGQAKAERQQSKQNIENYLRDIPERLWPRPTIMTENEKKKLVVRRLEHLFTGKMGNIAQKLPPPLATTQHPIARDTQMDITDDNTVPAGEAAREATIRPQANPKANHPLDGLAISKEHSQSHSYGEYDFTSERDSSSGANVSPESDNTSEQRPTRPRDLDPDREQVPSDNMNYIRHLGLDAPEGQARFSKKDVSTDADGWVYLNLLGNLAQLHILNVTPDFIRHAVSEKSTKFQLSPDGRKIRWRGGNEGTRFVRSDSSGGSSERTHSSEDTDGSNDQDQRKKRKTKHWEDDGIAQKPSKFGLGVQDSNSDESFHYKPMFVHHQTSSSDEQPSVADETASSYEAAEESNLGLGLRSRWNQSGVSTGVSQRQPKRRRDGAIIYYSGAPFCTDLSGDSCGLSPEAQPQVNLNDRPQVYRSSSGSSIPFRPLSGSATYGSKMKPDGSDSSELTCDETDDEIEASFPWADNAQRAPLLNLEASGLGGVYPDDHFVLAVSTRRPKRASSECDDSSDDGSSSPRRPRQLERPSHDTIASKTTTDTIAGGLATMTTDSPSSSHVSTTQEPSVEIEYVGAKIRRLPPVPLPPPAFYQASCDSDLDSDDDDAYEDEDSQDLIRRDRAVIEDGPFHDNRDLSGNDEEDEHSEDEHSEDEHSEDEHGYDASGDASPEDGDKFGCGRGLSDLSKMATGSSVATAGGAASGYNSSMEDV
ncbi:Uu.00g144460.m01.CDS01 [Anthostomella pinea]|uniref:Uu.00g144460.m01.CDS01 n=1 Tax=Anthostomella pinea TaxID=933095 RepID=A0AAI8VQW6_9PEZI|nr:Uu.00g144460.m01.CDS01 [Anthostomella pinea]